MVEGSANAYCVCGLSKDYNYLQLDYFFTIGKRWILDYFVYTMLSPLFRSGVRGAWGGGGGGGFWRGWREQDLFSKELYED
jgi:hypothetical protein